MDNVYLIGFMGTGKSTVASSLSKFLPFQVIEMDDTIERLEEKKISEIFESKGEEAFRTMETSLLRVLSSQNNQIISCGGGIVLKEENIELMKKTGTVCLLWASAKTVYNRLSEDTSRPLLQNKKSVEEIQTMMNSREKYYRNAADITVDVDEMTPEAVASELVKELALKGVLH